MTLEGLPYRPEYDGMFESAEVRKWYVAQTAGIAGRIDLDASLEQQARLAFDLRNTYKVQARAMMKDRKEAERLAVGERIKTFETLIAEKIIMYDLTEREAYEDMLRSSGVTRQSVNNIFGVR